ncbi:hypothetical protein HPULCUR_002962 [Helicostylum pulchrum]|uniref:Uncharacterized protein n=1 Tax=Helicostylum pulchrum TaxID=562976 RepID=A0ABP9XS07_9FUNG
MQQDVKIEVFNQNLEIDRPRTRAHIKQETEDSKEYLKSALYPPVKIESRSLDISKSKSIQFHGITLPGPGDIIQNVDDNPFLLHLATAHNKNKQEDTD